MEALYQFNHMQLSAVFISSDPYYFNMRTLFCWQTHTAQSYHYIQYPICVIHAFTSVFFTIDNVVIEFTLFHGIVLLGALFC